MLKSYLNFTKFGIVVFVLISGLAGYTISSPMGSDFQWEQALIFLLGLYLVTSGSFALNQSQEWKFDAKMERTKSRPIPKGELLPWQGWVIGFTLVFLGLFNLYLVSPLSSFLSLLTVLFYNVFYTMIWKRRWAFGAVPGAIPGAMPAVIGYSVNSSNLLSPECVYLFLIMYLWQMPHFWCLSIRYLDDYKSGGFPVLSSVLGIQRTMYHMGLYVFVYIGVALISPWFLRTHVLYLALVVPISLKVLYEFFVYLKSSARERWIHFFLWVNLSLIIYVGVPVFDRWVDLFVPIISP